VDFYGAKVAELLTSKAANRRVVLLWSTEATQK